MAVSAAIIGCSGFRFKNIYLPILKKNKRKIKILQVFNRTPEAAINVAKQLNCKIAEDVNEIFSNKLIKVIFFIVPKKARDFYFNNKNLKNKIVVTEVPVVTNILEYFFYKKKISKKKINLYVFEDRYYIYKDLFKKIKNNISELKIINLEWMHHAFGCMSAIRNIVGNIKKVHYIKNNISDYFLIYYQKLIFHYVFTNIKKSAKRSLGRLELTPLKKNFKKIIIQKVISKKAKINSFESFLNKNYINFIKNKRDKYFTENLKQEAFFVTIVKIHKKIRFQIFAKLITLFLIKTQKYI
jgi:hypothetical protein